MRRWWWLGMMGLLAGCTGGQAPQGVSGGATGSGTAPASGEKLQVGMVFDTGGIGDQSFNWMAWQGLQRAEKELGVAPTKAESQQQADYTSNLERMAERGCKVVFAVGFALEDAVKDVAPRYPDTYFALIDADGPQAANVCGLRFREEEGSYLVGALAGGMTKSKTLGFVGGMEIPLIKKFEAGYRAGAQTTQPQVQVHAKYTNNWEKVDTGRELALALYNQGADVVYHAAGRCGLGVIEAAKSKGPGFWAIGTDADQDHLGTKNPQQPAPPSRVLTSMMKRVDNVVFAVCQDVKEGKFQSGARVFGVKEEGVGLTPLTYTRNDVPEALRSRVEALRRQIADGKLKPPASMEELRTWKAPAVQAASGKESF